jgi:Major Facilitator Superfamily
MVPRRVLRARGFAVALASLGLGMATYGGYLFSMLLHLQTALGDSPLRAGLLFSPAAVVFAAASLSSRRLAPHVQRVTATAGLLVAAAGYGAIALDLRSGGNGGLTLELCFAFVGLGLGAAFTPLLNTALSHVPPSDASDASGVVATVQQLSLVTGIALFGSIYLSLNPSAAGPGAHRPGTAIGWSMAVLMITALIASGLSARLWRRGRPPLVGPRGAPAEHGGRGRAGPVPASAWPDAVRLHPSPSFPPS